MTERKKSHIVHGLVVGFMIGMMTYGVYSLNTHCLREWALIFAFMPLLMCIMALSLTLMFGRKYFGRKAIITIVGLMLLFSLTLVTYYFIYADDYAAC